MEGLITPRIKFLITPLLICAVSFTIYAQNEIVVGVKSSYPNNLIENQIIKDEINYLDAFEYELLGLLRLYADTSDVKLIYKEIEQKSRTTLLTEGKLNAILFTYSNTPERVADGILFSDPYFQNRAISLISNNKKIDNETWENETVNVGYIKKTTAEAELKNIKNRYFENVILHAYDNHEALLSALKNYDIDLAAGDVSRLIYEINEGDLFFAGNIKTKRAKVKDNYAIAISPGNPELLKFFNRFIEKNRQRINFLNEKWLGTSLEDAYGEHYGNSKDELIEKLKNYFIYTCLILLSTIVILTILLFRFRKKIKDGRLLGLENEMQEVVHRSFLKFESILDDKGILDAGIDMFNSAQKSIHYYGSGGFMSSVGKVEKEGAKKWIDSIEKSLKRQNVLGKKIKFVRVVDLPPLGIDEATKKKSILETDNVNLDSLKERTSYSSYLVNYHKWLFRIYSQMIRFEGLELYNSRDSGFWGFGLIFIVRDDEEVLVFLSSDKHGKIGTIIPSKKLAKEINNLYMGDGDKENIGKKILQTDFIDKIVKDGKEVIVSKFFHLRREHDKLLKIKKSNGNLGERQKNGKILSDEINEFCEKEYK